jgi:hypothetical protein
MMTFSVWRWNDAKGGMRFAFPPHGLGPPGRRRAWPRPDGLAATGPHGHCSAYQHYDLNFDFKFSI